MPVDKLLAVGAATLGVGLVVAVWRRRLRRPVIAIDFDEVCVGYLPAFIAFNNAKYGTSLQLRDFHSYMFWEVAGCKLGSREEATSRVYEFHASRYFGRITPIPGAAEGLKALSERFELHIVTSRQHDIADLTRACVTSISPVSSPASTLATTSATPARR